MAATTTLKRKRCDYSETPIAIVVGHEKKQFVLHPTILSNNSKFFRSSFCGRWAVDKPINLQDVEPSIFQIYAGYVYTGEIELTLQDTMEEVPLAEISATTKPRFDALVKLYILANMLDDKSLRNKVMDQVQDFVKEWGRQPGASCINMAFTATHDTSPLCRYLLDLFLSHTDPKWLETAWMQLPTIFITALMLGWAKTSFDRSVENKWPASMPKCTYHEHDDEVPMEDACAQGFVAAEPKTPKRPMKKPKITLRLI